MAFNRYLICPHSQGWNSFEIFDDGSFQLNYCSEPAVRCIIIGEVDINWKNETEGIMEFFDMDEIEPCSSLSEEPIVIKMLDPFNIPIKLKKGCFEYKIEGQSMFTSVRYELACDPMNCVDEDFDDETIRPRDTVYYYDNKRQIEKKDEYTPVPGKWRHPSETTQSDREYDEDIDWIPDNWDDLISSEESE